MELKKLKTGDLIDLIHDLVCGMGADGQVIPDAEIQELCELVEELRNRSLAARKTTTVTRQLDS